MTTWEQIFQPTAVVASIFFPNKSNSLALARPIDILKVCEEHSSGTRAKRVKGTQNVASLFQQYDEAENLRDQGKFDDAVAKCEAILEQDEAFVMAHLGLAHIFIKQERTFSSAAID